MLLFQEKNVELVFVADVTVENNMMASTVAILTALTCKKTYVKEMG